MQRKGANQPVAEVEQVHALIEQLAAARDRRVGPPLAIVAGAAAVPVAGAHVHRLAVKTRTHLGDRAGDAGVEAVVEAHLHQAPGRRRGVGDALDLGHGAPAGFSTSTWAPAASARQAASARASCVVATMTTSGTSARRASTSGTARAPVAAASSAARAASASQTADDPVRAEGGGALAAHQTASHDAHRAGSRVLLPEDAVEVEAEAHLVGAGRVHRLAQASRLGACRRAGSRRRRPRPACRRRHRWRGPARRARRPGRWTCPPSVCAC